MKYQTVADAYRDLERASGRLVLIDRLAALVAATPAELLPMVCYLCQGLIAAGFAGVDLGLAEKLAIRAVAAVTGARPEQVAGTVRETGDLGQAAERLLAVTAAGRPPGLEVADVVELLAAGLGPREAILEGEVVAFDPAAGELRPFGEVMLRRRKHGICEAVRDVPVSLFCFELLYADGRDLTTLPYPRRRAALAEAITVSPQLRLTTATQVTTPAALEAAFEQAVTDGCEGLVCKSVSPDASYRAGARGWQWIKLKRDYRTELSDTIDLVVVGAFAGRGRRAGIYGALLLAAYDPAADAFPAVTRCGTGFSDAELAALPARLAPWARPDRPARVDARQQPDVWFEPGVALEILGAELTLSPNYTAGWGRIKPDAGLAMRFPRFTGRWRDDKGATDATTTGELIDLYRAAHRAPARP